MSNTPVSATAAQLSTTSLSSSAPRQRGRPRANEFDDLDFEMNVASQGDERKTPPPMPRLELPPSSQPPSNSTTAAPARDILIEAKEREINDLQRALAESRAAAAAAIANAQAAEAKLATAPRFLDQGVIPAREATYNEIQNHLVRVHDEAIELYNFIVDKQRARDYGETMTREAFYEKYKTSTVNTHIGRTQEIHEKLHKELVNLPDKIREWSLSLEEVAKRNHWDRVMAADSSNRGHYQTDIRNTRDQITALQQQQQEMQGQMRAGRIRQL